ncbi:hypothetical protein [Aestuariivirga sp.]|uniref:hypothetical protein n=1 Tax=Aestuariivirga sp. TaxID=2650926 RepID=UPI0039E64D59
MTKPPAPIPFGKEDMARRRKRALAMALVLAALVVVFFVTTLVHLGGGVVNRSM